MHGEGEFEGGGNGFGNVPETDVLGGAGYGDELGPDWFGAVVGFFGLREGGFAGGFGLAVWDWEGEEAVAVA